MAVAVNDAIQQVLVRLAEDNTSTIAELPAGTGTASSATIATNTQVATFLDEGQKLFCRTPMGRILSTATKTLTAGDTGADYDAFTPLVSGQVPWRILSAKVGSTPVKVADPQWQHVYYPNQATTGVLAYVFDAGDNVTYGPVISSGGAGTLTITCLMLPRVASVGGNLTDIADHYVQYLISFACWRVCELNAAEPAFAAMLPNYRAEIAPWAGPLIGLGSATVVAKGAH
jgi:hypothetical protein